MSRLAPDKIIVDNTASARGRALESLHSYLDYARKPVALLPHAPHHAKQVAFAPFNSDVSLPDYCQFWMPFIHERAWEALPEQRSQFVYVGYPGLDQAWIERICPRPVPDAMAKGSPLRCLFVIRRFLAKDQPRKPGDNAYVYSYEEMGHFVGLLRNALQRQSQEIEVVIKPHPSNNPAEAVELFEQAGIPKCRLSAESIYAEASRIDLVVSLYSTVFFVPAMAGVPVIILNSSTQQVVHQWDVMKDLYTGFKYYLDDPGELSNCLSEVIPIALRRKAGGDGVIEDSIHLRQYFPDGAADRALQCLGFTTVS